MTAVPTVRTLRLTMRPWRETDIAPLTAILGDPLVTRYLFGAGEPLAPHEAREAYGRRLASWERDGVGFWAVELNATGELIGWSGLQRVDFERGLVGEIEIGWTLGREWWGCGYATEAAEAGLRWGFEDRGFECIHALCDPANRRSERVMEGLGMRSASPTSDIRDGSPSAVRIITRERWLARSDHSRIPNPHTDADTLARVIGYDVGTLWGVLSPLGAEELHDVLVAAIGRTWPGPELSGEPRVYRVTGDIRDLEAAMSSDRDAGLVPLLVSADISCAEDAGGRLAEIYVATLREGVWLHADIVARHGLCLDGLDRADSIAFDVPADHGRARVFATRHPKMLDEAFAEALRQECRQSGIG